MARPVVTVGSGVVVKADGGRGAMLVLDATDQCDLGTLPPVPIWGLPIYADYGDIALRPEQRLWRSPTMA